MIVRCQAMQPGATTRPVSVGRAKGDVFDVEIAEGAKWGSWLRRVPDSTPLIGDGKGLYSVKGDVARIIHDGTIVATFSVCEPYESPEVIEAA